MHDDEETLGWSTVGHRSNQAGGTTLHPLSPVTITCQMEGCCWEMEDFLPTGNPVFLHPLIAAFATHHTIEAHPEMLEMILDDQSGYSADYMKVEVMETFEEFGINPSDPYEHMELTFQ